MIGTRTPSRRKTRGTGDLGSGRQTEDRIHPRVRWCPLTTQGGGDWVDIVAKFFAATDAQYSRRDGLRRTMRNVGAKVCAVVVVDEEGNLGGQSF